MKKENYQRSLLMGLIIVSIGALSLLSKRFYFSDPIFIAFGLIMVTSSTFKIKKYCNRVIYTLIIFAILALMIMLEYFFIPIQNSILYILLLLSVISLFIIAHYLIIPENRQKRKDKTLLWTGVISSFIILFISIGLFFNNFMLPLYAGIFILILFLIIFLIRIVHRKVF